MSKLLALTLAAVLGGMTAPGAQDTSTLEDYLGRWNIHIVTEKDTFHCAWLKVERVDGALQGSFLWKWGSPGRIQDVSVDKGELTFRRGGMKLRCKLEGGKLLGYRTQKSGGKPDFVGWPASELCEVNGTWKVAPVDQPALVGTIVLKEREGKIRGDATDAQGNPFEVRDAKLDGYTLTFTAAAKNVDAERKVSCEIRGDLLVGKVDVPGQESIPIQGKRERVWGEPVVLLEKSTLKGWGPRDPKRNFGWTIQDGVLENGARDVDIMSERRFRDFRLHVEYKVAPGKNSGIYLRGQYELQILGVEPGSKPGDHGNMAVYGRLTPKTNAIRDLDEWQVVDVTLIGRWVTVVLNGVTIHDNAYLEGPTGGGIIPREEDPGPLMLQGDHGKIRFRNIVVTPAK